MVKKGIILAGGTATRLFPLTATTSKQLLPIYDRQMIFYPLNTLIKAGIRDILIIVSPDHGVRLVFEVQKVPRGLAEAFVLGENFIDNESVALILGDNIFENDFSEIVKNFKSGGQIFAKKVADPERLGVVKFDSQKRAVQIVEKPKQWVSDYAVPGFYIYDKKVVAIAKKIKPSARGEIEITDVNNEYLKNKRLKVGVIKGEWLDAGTFDSLLEAGNIVKNKKLYKNFHPLVDKAIAEFNEELKGICRKKLI